MKTPCHSCGKPTTAAAGYCSASWCQKVKRLSVHGFQHVTIGVAFPAGHEDACWRCGGTIRPGGSMRILSQDLPDGSFFNGTLHLACWESCAPWKDVLAIRPSREQRELSKLQAKVERLQRQLEERTQQVSKGKV
jgi:hypothetical protein